MKVFDPRTAFGDLSTNSAYVLPLRRVVVILEDRFILGRLHVVLTLLSFLVVSAVLRSLFWNAAGLSEDDPYTQKIALARLQDKPIDVLFVGPSYVDVGIDPSVFDQATAAAGYTVTSFNLGIGGLSVVELAEVVRSATQSKNCCKYVFLVPSFELLSILGSADSVRTIHFLDLFHAVDEALYIMNMPYDPTEEMKKKDYLVHIMNAVFRHYSNVGLGSVALNLSDASKSLHNWKVAPSWNSQGYTNAGDKVNDPNYAGELDNLRKSRAGFMAQVMSSEAIPLTTTSMIDRVVRMGREIEAVNAVPIVMIPPRITYWEWDADFLVRFTARCGGSHVLDFARPERFSELFAPEVRLDGGHLNAIGAALWSKRLAEDFISLIGGGKLNSSFCVESEDKIGRISSPFTSE